MKAIKQLSLFPNKEEQRAESTHNKLQLEPSVWKLYIDGASRNNPGKSGVGIHIEKDKTTICNHGFFTGIKTNNEAEYLALVIGLIVLETYLNPFDILEIISDSELLTKQMNGAYQIKKAELKKLALVAQHILAPLSYKIRHTLRENNAIADALANKGIDQQIKISEPILQRLQQHDIII